jgi:dCTP deaminase
VLAMTREKVHLKPGSKLAARVEGRSSLARIGLVVHLTAPIIHTNFNASITLEMINHGPFLLRLVPHKTVICQLIVEQLESEPLGDSNGVSTPNYSSRKIKGMTLESSRCGKACF